MDLTLFILLIFIILSILYFINLIKSLKEDIKYINNNCLKFNNKEIPKTNDYKFIDNIKSYLDYIKNFF